MPTLTPTDQQNSANESTSTISWLRHYSKITCLLTLFLIFAGGMVTSTGSGLAVPDWPLSYGTLFPPMVGGIFYEHGHRMIATLVGCCTLILAIALKFQEKRSWVKRLGYWSLATVIVQGLLGGITVLFLLPTPVSITHAVLAQTFFLLIILLAYSLSSEFNQRETITHDRSFLKLLLLFIIFVYIQLIFGAIMRHTGSGLAIPDFPKMGGTWFPRMNATMLSRINDWRFNMNLDPVNMMQIIYHLLHRLWAVVLLGTLAILNIRGLKLYRNHSKIFLILILLDLLFVLQITLGILTVFSAKAPLATSYHVTTGAGILGVSFFLFLRSAPLTLVELKTMLSKKND